MNCWRSAEGAWAKPLIKTLSSKSSTVVVFTVCVSRDRIPSILARGAHLRTDNQEQEAGGRSGRQETTRHYTPPLCLIRVVCEGNVQVLFLDKIFRAVEWNHSTNREAPAFSSPCVSAGS